MRDVFDLTGQVAVITGGAGLLGQKHAEAIASKGGIPVLLDLPATDPQATGMRIGAEYGVKALGCPVNIADPSQVQGSLTAVLSQFGHVDILINNAANNPKVEDSHEREWTRLERFPLAAWEADIAVALTGAFLCSQAFGTQMASQRRGVIVNVASDLAVIGPDQRLYRQEGLREEEQPVKPVSYSVVKAGLIGLTRYLATYWAQSGVRVNAISPGGVFNGQADAFVARLSSLIPLARMARVDEYQGAIIFLCSEASSYMTGFNLVVDGGRSSW